MLSPEMQNKMVQIWSLLRDKRKGGDRERPEISPVDSFASPTLHSPLSTLHPPPTLRSTLLPPPTDAAHAHNGLYSFKARPGRHCPTVQGPPPSHETRRPFSPPFGRRTCWLLPLSSPHRFRSLCLCRWRTSLRLRPNPLCLYSQRPKPSPATYAATVAA